jgi:hypothetical protein
MFMFQPHNSLLTVMSSLSMESCAAFAANYVHGLWTAP